MTTDRYWITPWKSVDTGHNFTEWTGSEAVSLIADLDKGVATTSPDTEAVLRRRAEAYLIDRINMPGRGR